MKLFTLGGVPKPYTVKSWLRFSPEWMRWISRLKSIDSGCPWSAGRRATSLAFGLWHITHSCGFCRWPPWSASWSWHVLQLAMSTTTRRAATSLPSTEASKMGLKAASVKVVASSGCGSSVTVRRASMLKVHVPFASAGIAWVNV